MLHLWQVDGCWLYRASIVSLHPPINAEQETGQAASTVFQVFGVTRLGNEPSLSALVARAVPLIRWFHLSNADTSRGSFTPLIQEINKK